MLKLVQGCSEARHMPTISDDACIFIYRNGDLFKIALVWTTSEETDAGQTWGWKQLR